MKLKKYIEELNKLVKKHPEALNLDVITSKDDEGNGYNFVHYAPCVGLFEEEDYTPDHSEPNAVCLN